MKVIELVKRDENDPLVHMIYESHKLVSRSIDEGNPLCERFKDTRTPYEQYCSGEKYLKYDDETLYSRAAHEFMFNNFCHMMFPSRKNFMMIDMKTTEHAK